MNPLDDIILKSILNVDSNGKVLQKEDDRIEYKEVFDNGSKEAKAKYAKEMAALYNFEGGYLIFGVNDDNELTGLSDFTEPDNADLVNDINTYFSPAIRFQTKYTTVHGKDVFVIYVEKRNSIPTVCTKSHQDVLKESTIFWRYSAKSAQIASGDLINLLNALKGENSKELTEIAKKEFRSKFKPRLWSNGGTYNNNERTLKISLDNRGELCYVDKFEYVDGDQVFFYNRNSAILLDKGKNIQLSGKPAEKAPGSCVFRIKIYYHDQEEFKYESILEWSSGTTRIIETKEL